MIVQLIAIDWTALRPWFHTFSNKRWQKLSRIEEPYNTRLSPILIAKTLFWIFSISFEKLWYTNSPLRHGLLVRSRWRRSHGCFRTLDRFSVEFPVLSNIYLFNLLLMRETRIDETTSIIPPTISHVPFQTWNLQVRSVGSAACSRTSGHNSFFEPCSIQCNFLSCPSLDLLKPFG